MRVGRVPYPVGFVGRVGVPARDGSVSRLTLEGVGMKVELRFKTDHIHFILTPENPSDDQLMWLLNRHHQKERPIAASLNSTYTDGKIVSVDFDLKNGFVPLCHEIRVKDESGRYGRH